jgi:hypothetical protein
MGDAHAEPVELEKLAGLAFRLFHDVSFWRWRLIQFKARRDERLFNFFGGFVTLADVAENLEATEQGFSAVRINGTVCSVVHCFAEAVMRL